MNDDGLRSFQDLTETLKLSSNSYFLYVQLHSALRAAGILTDGKPLNHPIMELFKKISDLPKVMFLQFIIICWNICRPT